MKSILRNRNKAKADTEKMSRKISKIVVKRKVEKTIQYRRVVEKKMEINPIDISVDEIYTLDHNQAMAIAVMFKTLYDKAAEAIAEYLEEARISNTQNQAAVPQTTEVGEVEAVKEADTSVGEIGIVVSEKEIEEKTGVGSRVDDDMDEKVGSGKVDSSAKKQSMRGTHSTGVKIGTKRGKTSEYHYVYWDSSKSKWANVFTKKVFDDEWECAEEVNRYLDIVGDNERPKNVRIE